MAGGRPRKEIDWEEFDKLCEYQATLEEIAAWFDVSPDTIERACLRDKEVGFAEYSDLKRGAGRASLRRAQYQSAMSGNTTMQIWLGKQMLGQKDKQEHEVSGKDGKPITVKVVKVGSSDGTNN
jgi:hypothetical protein